jgi:Arc/MetJ-type ribon-helix-helix transcriptional regulator
MPGLVVNITPDLHNFVQSNVKRGRYENVIERVRIALLSQLLGQQLEETRSISGQAKSDVFRNLREVSI